MSGVAALKAKFEKNTTPNSFTPEGWAIKAKMMKDKEAEAERVAKARAARYNITLRSVQLAYATQAPKPAPRVIPTNVVKGATADDYRRMKPATGRKVSVGVVDPVAEALSHERTASVARAVVEAAAHVTEEVPAPAVEEAAAVPPPAVEEAAAVADAPAPEPEAAFEMTELKAAIESGDQEAINTAVVTEFLETHAPELVAEVPQLLEEHKGHEAELMEQLVKEHPDPAEAIEQHAEALINHTEQPTPEEVKEIAEVAAEEGKKEAEAEQVAAAAVDEELKEELKVLEETIAEAEKTPESAPTAAVEQDVQFIVAAESHDGVWTINPEEVVVPPTVTEEGAPVAAAAAAEEAATTEAVAA